MIDLLKAGADLNYKDKNGETALKIATEQGHLEVVKYLVEKGVDLNQKYYRGSTILQIAARKGHLAIVKFLIEKEGINIFQLNEDNNHVLHYLFYSRKDEGYLITKMLIDNITSNFFEILNQKVGAHYANPTLLDMCVNEDMSAIPSTRVLVSYLLKKGATIPQRRYARRETRPDLLHMGDSAIRLVKLADQNLSDPNYNEAKTIAEASNLVKTLGFGLNGRNTAGNTALHLAIMHRNLPLAKFLISKAADLNIPNNQNATPRQLISNSEWKDLLDIKQGSEEKENKDWVLSIELEQLHALIESITKAVPTDSRIDVINSNKICHENIKKSYYLRIAQIKSEPGSKHYNPKEAREILQPYCDKQDEEASKLMLKLVDQPKQLMFSAAASNQAKSSISLNPVNPVDAATHLRGLIKLNLSAHKKYICNPSADEKRAKEGEVIDEKQLFESMQQYTGLNYQQCQTILDNFPSQDFDKLLNILDLFRNITIKDPVMEGAVLSPA